MHNARTTLSTVYIESEQQLHTLLDELAQDEPPAAFRVHLWPELVSTDALVEETTQALEALGYFPMWQTDNTYTSRAHNCIVLFRERQDIVELFGVRNAEAITWLLEGQGISIDWAVTQVLTGFVPGSQAVVAQELIAAHPELSKVATLKELH